MASRGRSIRCSALGGVALISGRKENDCANRSEQNMRDNDPSGPPPQTVSEPRASQHDTIHRELSKCECPCNDADAASKQHCGKERIRKENGKWQVTPMTDSCRQERHAEASNGYNYCERRDYSNLA